MNDAHSESIQSEDHDETINYILDNLEKALTQAQNAGLIETGHRIAVAMMQVVTEPKRNTSRPN